MDIPGKQNKKDIFVVPDVKDILGYSENEKTINYIINLHNFNDNNSQCLGTRQ